MAKANIYSISERCQLEQRNLGHGEIAEPLTGT